MESALAIVTPSYRPDLELCRRLNASVLRFLPETVRHYILVPRSDLKLFRPLESRRTSILAVEEIVPAGYFQLGSPEGIKGPSWFSMTRWFSTASIFPISGWLMQQIVKISSAQVVTEPALLMVDSDIEFIRLVSPERFFADGKTRLFRAPRAIDAGMTAHVKWHGNACRLLGIPAEDPPMDDYIGPLITWNRKLVIGMCERIEATTGHRWDRAIVRARRVSEYLAYGLYVDRVVGQISNMLVDENRLCLSHWSTDYLSDATLDALIGELNSEHVALMISAHSPTPLNVRQAAVDRVIRRASLVSA